MVSRIFKQRELLKYYIGQSYGTCVQHFIQLQQGYLQSLKKQTPVLFDLRWKKKKYDKKIPHPLRTRSHTVNVIIKGLN